MKFERIPPSPVLKSFVECYWQVESDDPAEQVQKIIPDGYPEMIFHYRSPYCIRLKDNWEQQSQFLLGGQIRKYFHLKNTGPSGVFGIKFKPAALTHLFGLQMHKFTDRVVDLAGTVKGLEALPLKIVQSNDIERQVDLVENYLKGIIPHKVSEHAADRSVEFLRERGGHVTVAELCDHVATAERSLERIFRTYIGLSPKFLARIIRFNKIFELVQLEDPSWGDLVYETGYYDQSHFIRNFKAFTGEDPTRYMFASPSLANFFLQKEKKPI